MNTHKILMFLIVVSMLISIFVLSSCEKQETTGQAAFDFNVIKTQNNLLSDIEKTQTKEFEIKITDYRFYPANIEVNKGDNVLLRITSDKETGFALNGYGINTRVPKDLEIKELFVADKTGTFTFDCGNYCQQIKEDLEPSKASCSKDDDCGASEQCLRGTCEIDNDELDVLGTRYLKGRLIVR